MLASPVAVHALYAPISQFEQILSNFVLPEKRDSRASKCQDFCLHEFAKSSPLPMKKGELEGPHSR
jgi:hypothetical protein